MSHQVLTPLTKTAHQAAPKGTKSLYWLYLDEGLEHPEAPLGLSSPKKGDPNSKAKDSVELQNLV